MSLSENLMQSIAWTLLHSLWQGLIAALLAGIIIVCTRKATAAIRYRLLVYVLIAFLMVTIGTFWYEFNIARQEQVILLPAQATVPESIAVFKNAPVLELSNAVGQLLDKYAPVIVMVWFVFFAFRLFGIFKDFLQIYRLRNYRNFPVSDYWNSRIKTLAEAIDLRQTVVLLESAVVKVPSVSGFFKPIVLVPFGMLAHLPADQAEVILLHELAHIKRKDYLINLLQQLAGLVFFFNPGLLWLSALLCEERENCCDDIAVSAIDSKTQLVRALVSFEEYTFEKASLALGFGQKKPHLLARARRLLQNDNDTLGRWEKTLLSLGFLVFGIGLFACSGSQQALDRLSAQHERELASHNKQMQADAKIYDKIAQNTQGYAIDTKRQTADIETPAAIAPPGAPPQVGPITDVPAHPPATITQTIVNPLAALPPDANCTPAEKITRVTTSKTQTLHTVEKEQTLYDPHAGKYRKTAVRTGISGEHLPESINLEVITGSIISDLLSENIIADTENLSYMLSKTQLIVNGQQQSSALHTRLQRKYVLPRYHTICYNYAL